MRNTVAKRLKKEVAFKMYIDAETTPAEVQKMRKDVYASSDFKPVYRARKKKYVNPRHSTSNTSISGKTILA